LSDADTMTVLAYEAVTRLHREIQEKIDHAELNAVLQPNNHIIFPPKGACWKPKTHRLKSWKRLPDA
jgi:hypothetical protein